MKFEDVVGFLSSFHRATMVSLGVPTARFGHLDDNDWVRWMAPQDRHFRREKKAHKNPSSYDPKHQL